MKQLNLRVIHVDPKTRNEITFVEGAPQESYKVLELSWYCDACKYHNKHLLKYKPAYSEKDLLAAVQATHNMMHFSCGCDETKESV